MTDEYKQMMSEALAEKLGSINGIEQQIADRKQQSTGILNRINIAPIAAVLDSQNGTNVASHLAKQTPDEKNQMVIGKLQQALAKGKDEYGDQAMSFFKTGSYMDQVANQQKNAEASQSADRWYKGEVLKDNDLDRDARVNKGGVGGGLTKGQESVDKAFGKTYEEQFLSGQIAAAEKNVENLISVSTDLLNRDDLTGGGVGNTPMWLRRNFHQASADTQQKVEDVVQQSLKAILGAQFTEKEAARLIERAYDPLLDESINRERVGRLYKALKKGIQSKKRAGVYFENHGTMAGFKGTSYSNVDAILEDMSDSGEKKQAGKGAGLPPLAPDIAAPDFDTMTDEQIDAYIKGQ